MRLVLQWLWRVLRSCARALPRWSSLSAAASGAARAAGHSLVSQFRRPGGAGRLPSRRRVAAQLRLRGSNRRVSRGAENRSAALRWPTGARRCPSISRSGFTKTSPRAARRWRSWAPRRRRARQRRARRASRHISPPSRRSTGRRQSRRATARTPMRWRRWRRSSRRTTRRRRSTRWRCSRCCRAATRRCRCARRPARSPKACSRATRSIPAPRTTSCTPTITRTLAAKALPAARVYAKIAPAASHALHMPAHAFVQLGLLGRSRGHRSGVLGRVGGVGRAQGLSVALRDFHSLTWLHYEWTQQGRFSKAAEALQLVDAALKVVKPSGQAGGHHYADSEIGRGSGPMALRNDRGSMRARYIIESERWSEMKGQGNFDNIDELFALGMASVRIGDLAAGRCRVEAVRRCVGARQDAGLREQAAVMARELEALVPSRAAGTREAFAAMDQATYAAGAHAEADRAAVSGEGRRRAVWGAAAAGGPRHATRSSGSSGRWRARRTAAAPCSAWRARPRRPAMRRKAAAAYKQFLANWKSADTGIAEVQEALGCAEIGRARAALSRWTLQLADSRTRRFAARWTRRVATVCRTRRWRRLVAETRAASGDAAPPRVRLRRSSTRRT